MYNQVTKNKLIFFFLFLLSLIIILLIPLLILLLTQKTKIENQFNNLKLCNIEVPKLGNILVYIGKGTDKISTNNLLYALKIFSDEFVIITSDNFNNISSKIDLIIIPSGGLNKMLLSIAQRNNLIKFVENGKNLLCFGNNCFPVLDLNITCFSSFDINDTARGQVLLKFSYGLFQECYCNGVSLCNKLISFNNAPIFKKLRQNKMPIKASNPINLVFYQSGVPLNYPDLNFGTGYAAIVSNTYGDGKIIMCAPEPYNLLNITLEISNKEPMGLFRGLILYSLSS